MKHASVDRSKRVDSGCRNHGSCPYCRGSRTLNERKTRLWSDEQMKAWHRVATMKHKGRTLEFHAHLGEQTFGHWEIVDGAQDERAGWYTDEEAMSICVKALVGVRE